MRRPTRLALRRRSAASVSAATDLRPAHRRLPLERMDLGLAAGEDLLQRLDAVGLARRLVPADAVDAREAHGDAGFVPGRALQPLEGDLQHEAPVGPYATSRTGPKRLMVWLRT